jgi:hypothetical protein
MSCVFSTSRSGVHSASMGSSMCDTSLYSKFFFFLIVLCDLALTAYLPCSSSLPPLPRERARDRIYFTLTQTGPEWTCINLVGWRREEEHRARYMQVVWLCDVVIECSIKHTKKGRGDNKTNRPVWTTITTLSSLSKSESRRVTSNKKCHSATTTPHPPPKKNKQQNTHTHTHTHTHTDCS